MSLKNAQKKFVSTAPDWQSQLKQGFALHQEGKASDAAELYRQVLRQNPDQPDALHLLGLATYQAGDCATAILLMAKASALAPKNADLWSNLGNAYLASNRLLEAEDALGRARTLQPNSAGIRFNLGNVLRDRGLLDDACQEYEAALSLDPMFVAALLNWGNLLMKMKRFEDAENLIRKAASLAPGDVQTQRSLSQALFFLQRWDEAAAICRSLIRSHPTDFDAWFNLGVIEEAECRWTDAESAFKGALACRPNDGRARLGLGRAIGKGGRWEEAEPILRQASEEFSQSPEVLRDYGACLIHLGLYERALELFEKAIGLAPDRADICCNAGAASVQVGQLDDAIVWYSRALELAPDHDLPWAALAAVLAEYGDSDQAIKIYQEGVARNPDSILLLSSCLLAMQGSDLHSPMEAAELAKCWAAKTSPLTAMMEPPKIDRNPERRLRIGYVSGDFHEHPAGRFILPILASHDRDNYEIVCYPTTSQCDELTDLIRQFAQTWRPIFGVNDDEAARIIRDDRIDILFDLSGHTLGNRLGVFGLKPAPIQVSWLGYSGTTGLAQMDYILASQIAVPETEEAQYVEKPLRLSPMVGAFPPPEGNFPVSKLPAIKNGKITFGYFGKLDKVTQAVLDTWAKILGDLPDARLLFNRRAFRCDGVRSRITKQLEIRGVQPERLEFRSTEDRHSYYQGFQDVDFCLDTWPYAGCSVTWEALTMGVPVVTLSQNRWASHLGESILRPLGLDEWVVQSAPQYRAKVVEVCSNLRTLEKHRRTLRARCAQSQLCDPAALTRELEAALRAAWRSYALCPLTKLAS